MIIFSLQRLATQETCYEGGVPKTRGVSPGIEQTLAREGEGIQEGEVRGTWLLPDTPNKHLLLVGEPTISLNILYRTAPPVKRKTIKGDLSLQKEGKRRGTSITG